MKNYKYNHGLLVMRAQPFHKGHKSLLDKMFKECKNMTIILGSTQEEKTIKNPFTLNERKEMLKNVYGKNPRFKKVCIFGLDDIPNDDEWYDYVLENIKKNCPNFGEVEAYYCGDDDDGHWFDDGKIKIVKIERKEQKGKKLISATKIREMVKEGDSSWKHYIPKENIKFLEKLIKQMK